VDLSAGYRVEVPDVLVPWHISEQELLNLLPSAPRHVTTGYYTLPCASLGGLQHDLGFHFAPRAGGRLVELELFRRSYPDLHQSFEEFQRHLVQTFGEPSAVDDGDAGFPHFTWRMARARVVHYVLDRFGPEEHVRVSS
jgi:hypothetical protein